MSRTHVLHQATHGYREGPPGHRQPLTRCLALLSVLSLVMFSAGRAQAASVYYVDQASPNASPTGPGTASRPYLTISDALNAHPDAGVTVVVKPGVYRERVLVPASGEGSRPVVIRAQGAVTLDGADDLANSALWANSVGDVWVASSVNWEPLQVFADGVRLQPSTQPAAQVEPGRFRYVVGSGLAVNVGGGNPASHAVAVGRRAHGFLILNKQHVVIDGFTITRTESKGVEVMGSSRVIVKNNVVNLSAAGGIAAENSSYVQVYGNTVSDNNHHGILFRLGVTNSIIDVNESFANAHVGEPWATGIYLSGSPNNVVEGNRLHHNQDSGCEVQTGSNDNIVRQNVSWSNGDHGFAQLFATGTKLLNNVAWGNHTEGFSVEGNATGTKIYNCISLNRALAPESYCVYVDSSSTAGFDADYNIYWNVADQPPIKFGPTAYPNVAAFQTATGIGLNSFGADPRFVDATNGDFHLRSDSPAIDAATSAVPGWAETDAEGRFRSDDPGVPNSGAGPLGFADRGAYEYQSAVLGVGGRLSGPALSLSNAYPNPSRRSVAFMLELPAAGDVSWTVFDVLGREVWSEQGVRPGGRSELRWPLTSRAGARVPNGVYLVRVNRGDQSASMRFVVMQ